MPSFTSLVSSAACLTAIVSAFPAPLKAPKLVQRQHETDCPSGTWFYTCANGYRGCFSKDPCSLPRLTATTTTTTTTTTMTTNTITPTTMATVTTAIAVVPTSTTLPARPIYSCPAGADAFAEARTPTMYIISPTQPNKSQPPVSYINLHFYGNESQAEQVAVWTGIPANARSCSLGWAQGDKAHRKFVANGLNSRVLTKRMTGLPSDGQLSFNSVEPLIVNPQLETSIEFTGWDESADARTHGGLSFDCAETVALKLQIAASSGTGDVYMDQDAVNGLYISYKC